MIAEQQIIDTEIYNRRIDLRSVYNTPKGREELARQIIRSGVLSEIPCTPEAVALHNEQIRKLDEMGVLDEEGLAFLIEWLITQPVAYKSPVETIRSE